MVRCFFTGKEAWEIGVREFRKRCLDSDPRGVDLGLNRNAYTAGVNGEKRFEIWNLIFETAGDEQKQWVNRTVKMVRWKGTFVKANFSNQIMKYSIWIPITHSVMFGGWRVIRKDPYGGLFLAIMVWAVYALLLLIRWKILKNKSRARQ